MSQRGFTILEVMMAIGIFAIVSASMMPVFVSQLRSNTNTEIRSEAIAVAQRELDNLRFDDISSLPSSGSATPTNTTIGERSYEVTRNYCTVPTLCISSSTRQVRVDVRYRGRLIYDVETVFSQLR